MDAAGCLVLGYMYPVEVPHRSKIKIGIRPTRADENHLLFRNHSPSLSSRPERTRISYFALLATSTCAALRRESRMHMLKATGLHRKSGGA
jgi:hypothetical protein